MSELSAVQNKLESYVRVKKRNEEQTKGLAQAE